MINFVIGAIYDDLTLEVRSAGKLVQTTTVQSGNHELPVVAVPAASGHQSVLLWVNEETQAFYLHRIEIQPLDS